MIRPIVKDDVSKLVDLGRDFWLSSEMKKTGPYPKECVYRRLYSGFLSRELVGWCNTINDEIICAAIFTVCENFWTFDKQMSELAWFAKPSSRGTLSNVKILKEAEKYAKKEGIKLFCMARIRGVDTHSKLYDFYLKSGYFELESIFLKIL